MRIGWDRGYFLLLFLLFSVLLNADLRDDGTYYNGGTPTVRAVNTRIDRPNEEAAYMPQDLKEILIREMKAKATVGDALIREEGGCVLLSTEVSPDCGVARARHLGEDFVRLYVLLSPSEPWKPAPRIRETQYDYRIGVSQFKGHALAYGYKPRHSPDIIWK